jgi:hypothetical protein
MNTCTKCALVIHKNATSLYNQQIKLSSTIKILYSSEQEKKHTYSNTVQSTFPIPHCFMFLAHSPTSLCSQHFTFGQASPLKMLTVEGTCVNITVKKMPGATSRWLLRLIPLFHFYFLFTILMCWLLFKFVFTFPLKMFAMLIKILVQTLAAFPHPVFDLLL